MGSIRPKLRLKPAMALLSLTIAFVCFQNFTYQDGLQELKVETLGNVEERMWEKMKRRWLGSESILFEEEKDALKSGEKEMQLVWSKANELQMRFDPATKVSCEVNPKAGMKMEFSKSFSENTRISFDHKTNEARSAIHIEHSW
jgi:hypothetical protein